MFRLFRWLIGYVEFCFSGGFIEGFINDCFSQNISIGSLQKIDDVLVGTVLPKNYKRLRHIASKHSGKLKIIKRRGPIFAFSKIKNRYGLFAGLIAFLFIVNFLSGFVWDIKITGASAITDNEIKAIINDNDLSIGTRWSSVNQHNMQNYLMAAFPNCAWTHINKQGTSAIIEIKESRIKPSVDPKMTPTNLKAKKDGIIVEAYTHGGWRVAEVGDSVKKGDLLVSGVHESELNKTNIYAHGSGEYIAKVSENFDLVVNRTQSVKEYKEFKFYKKLVLYNLKLPLYIGKIDYNSCDVSTKKQYLTIKNKRLPIGVVTTTIKPYEQKQIILDDSELTNLINTEIEKKIYKELGQYEIISRNIDVSLNENSAVASGSVECLEDIGEIVEIMKDDNILCSITQNKTK